MTEKDFKAINNFNDKCNDFLNGKYILADIKVRAILRAINESDVLTSLVARCVNNYDFNEGFKKATGDELGQTNTLTLPDKDRERIALIYHILRYIDEEVISFYDFVNKYIRQGNEIGNEEFTTFANLLIKPFNDSINNLLKSEYSDKDLASSTRSMRAMDTYVNQTLENIEDYRLNALDSKDLKTLLTALSTALTRSDDQLVNALMIGIDNFCQCHHRARPIIKELNKLSVE